MRVHRRGNNETLLLPLIFFQCCRCRSAVPDIHERIGGNGGGPRRVRSHFNYLPFLLPASKKLYSSTISIVRVTLNTEFDTLWLLPRIVKSTISNLTNGTLVDRGEVHGSILAGFHLDPMHLSSSSEGK